MSLRIGVTIHAAMGATVGKIVTSCVLKNTELWCSEQVVVLLSRTRYLKDIYFVGSKSETIEALLLALQLKSRFHFYMRSLLRTLE